MLKFKRIRNDDLMFGLLVLIILACIGVGVWIGDNKQQNETNLLQEEMQKTRAALELYPNSVILVPSYMADAIGFEARRKDLVCKGGK
ncbi:MAG TPA: hypothetical protein ENG80_00830 [Nitrospirae bacterium]|nr:hypothetical protein [Nitrospirota bacterium]HDH51251.1 hypothetical protein [Nitrospirota bacterium]HDK81032.1 hypothetical protein [Nitrospirota bacterium]